MDRPFTFMQLKPIRFEPNEKKKDGDEDLKSDTDQSGIAKLEEKLLPPPRNQSERRDSLDILADCAASLRTYGNVWMTSFVRHCDIICTNAVIRKCVYDAIALCIRKYWHCLTQPI